MRMIFAPIMSNIAPSSCREVGNIDIDSFSKALLVKPSIVPASLCWREWRTEEEENEWIGYSLISPIYYLGPPNILIAT